MVRIQWRDAFTSGLHWGRPEDGDPEPAVITSVGWLIDHPLEGHVTIAQSIAADGMAGEMLHVPEAMVDEVTVLHPEPPPRTYWRWFSR